MSAGKDRDQQERGHQPAPDEERQLHHRHARRAQVENRHDDIDRGHQRRGAKQEDGEDREIDARAALHRERRIHGPAGIDRAVADADQLQDERQDEDDCRRRQQPEAPIVKPRQRHVRRADHQRNEIIGKARRHRHQRAEHHDEAMQRDDLIVDFRRQQMIGRMDKLAADQFGEEAAEQKHRQPEQHVKDADVLMIGRRQPARQALRLVMGVVMAEVGCGAAHRVSSSQAPNLILPARPSQRRAGRRRRSDCQSCCARRSRERQHRHR